MTTWGEHHWIIEDNTVRQVNAVAIEIGAFIDELSGSGDQEVLEMRTGGHLVRGNHVSACGWQEVQSYLGTGDIKILLALDLVVQCNHIHHCYAAPGIWIDFANRNSWVCRNLLHDITVANGGIFFEGSKPQQIDHNIIYSVEGLRHFQQDCDRLLIDHNLMQNNGAAGLRMREIQHLDRVGVCKNDHVVNNIIAGCLTTFDYEIMENISNYNLLSNIGEAFSLSEWQATGLDTDSRMVKID